MSPPADDLRALPPVHAVVDHVLAGDAALPRAAVVESVRAALEAERARVAEGAGPARELAEIAIIAEQAVRAAVAPTLVPLVNATGIIIHTGLGRAPLAEAAARAAADAARRYVPVELELDDGGRGRRAEHVRSIICDLTGAASATVVNNNAGALVLVLAALARARPVIVSRGELVEIGGSYRLPDVMAASGAILREVGTTNRTRLGDYERAIDETTAALLKVHTSNFRIEGFTESVPTGALAELGRARDVPIIDDIGSGALVPTSVTGWPSVEPDATSSLRAGADLVLFSGDKLLGGPQAGIIAGRADLIQRIEAHPLMRALRLDKIRLAALAATLQLHRDPAAAGKAVPVLAMLTAPADSIRRRCERLAGTLRHLGADVRVQPSEAHLGGGAVPVESVESFAVVIEAGDDERGLARRLRMGTPGVMARVQDGAVWLDLRTVAEDEDEVLMAAVRTALESRAS
jgi:L-seryl-tRNA(Ser) seleniumtransferase